MDPFKQLRIAILLVLALLAIGTFGYIQIQGLSPLDALYMTVITITTVGYEVVKPLDKLSKIYTIVLSLASFFIVFAVIVWVIGNAMETAVSDRMQGILWRKKMEKIIRGMKNHYIICGYGRMGQAIASEFIARDIPFVVIESNPEQLPRLMDAKIPFIQGNATEDEALIEAGVANARGLTAVAPTDADNTFIVLTAKGLNPKLHIVARSIKKEDEAKLRRAGADRVLSPYTLGGKRMAWAVLRPNVVDFLESAACSESLEMEISELPVTKNTHFVGKLLRDSQIREKTGATIIAIKEQDGTMTSSPPADTQLKEGQILVAVGTPAQLEALQKMTNN